MQTQENKLEASLVILPFHVKSQGRDLRFFIILFHESL